MNNIDNNSSDNYSLMTIERIVNGKTMLILLTKDEMVKAYNMQRNDHLIHDVQMELNKLGVVNGVPAERLHSHKFYDDIISRVNENVQSFKGQDIVNAIKDLTQNMSKKELLQEYSDIDKNMSYKLSYVQDAYNGHKIRDYSDKYDSIFEALNNYQSLRDNGLDIDIIYLSINHSCAIEFENNKETINISKIEDPIHLELIQEVAKDKINLKALNRTVKEGRQ